MVRETLLIVAGVLMLAGLAGADLLPFTPVPITGQTFGVLLISAAWLRNGRSDDARLHRRGAEPPFFPAAEAACAFLRAPRQVTWRVLSSPFM
jgi:hypothetical protein